MMAGGLRLERFRSVENLLPIFELLDQSTNLGAKEEALRILSQISADKECRVAISQAGGVGSLVEILKETPGRAETLIPLTMRTIRNLANDGPALRKALRQADTTQYLVQLLSQKEDTPEATDAVAALGYLAHHDQQTKALIRKMGGIPILVRMLHAGFVWTATLLNCRGDCGIDVSKAITCYAAAALHNLIDGSSKNKAALLAAGAVPRFVQLLDCDVKNPVLEVAIRALQKLSEKFEQGQTAIRRSKGLSKLIELQTKVAHPKLLNWIDQCLQALKLSEKETDDSKVLLTLGTAFQKEFDQIRTGSDNVLATLKELSVSINGAFEELRQRTNTIEDENNNLRNNIIDKETEISELAEVLEEKSIELQNAQGLIQLRDSRIQETESLLNQKETEIQQCTGALAQKENYLSKVEGILQEKDSQVRLLETALKDKNQHADYLEALILEKERQINEALADDRRKAHKSKSERDTAILELVHTFRDVVTSSSPTSPCAFIQDHDEVREISDSIQSLIRPDRQTTAEENPITSKEDIWRDRLVDENRISTKPYISRSCSEPVPPSEQPDGKVPNSLSLTKHSSIQPPNSQTGKEAPNLNRSGAPTRRTSVARISNVSPLRRHSVLPLSKTVSSISNRRLSLQKQHS